MHLIEDHAQKAGIPVRFAATKLVEGDAVLLEQLGLDQNEKEMCKPENLSDFELLAELAAENEKLQKELEEAYESWLELE